MVRFHLEKIKKKRGGDKKVSLENIRNVTMRAIVMMRTMMMMIIMMILMSFYLVPSVCCANESKRFSKLDMNLLHKDDLIRI